MNDDVILSVENVSKLYRLGTVGTGTFGGDVQRFWKTKVLGQDDPFVKIGQTNDRTSKGKKEFIWALQDINFEVKRGEVLGVIGKNGAGKSTLLKLLSRITSPTTGRIKSAGRIASLLEVGTGFHPELTGRENIFLNGAILGMTKKEIKSKFDEIVDFSGCNLYIDTPTKRYSSGMTVRLGFAVAAFLDPEILVVDEVLAVGDAEFQKKAIGKMKEVSAGGGRTVLFVSHNLSSVSQLCNRGILLENGTINFTGNIEECISKYLYNGNIVSKVFNYEGDKSLPIFLNRCRLVLNEVGEEIEIYNVQDEVCIECEFVKTDKFTGTYLHLTISDESENLLIETDSFEHGSNVFDTVDTGIVIVNYKFPSRTFNRGKYYISIGLSSKRIDPNQIQSLIRFISFEVNAAEYPRDHKRRSLTAILPKMTYEWITK